MHGSMAHVRLEMKETVLSLSSQLENMAHVGLATDSSVTTIVTRINVIEIVNSIYWWCNVIFTQVEGQNKS